MSHGGSMSHQGTTAIEKLINSTSMTHTAVRSGSWSDPKTWKGGRVPGKSANVLIAKGVTVTYDTVGEVDLKTVAVRGRLQFATWKDTQMRVETIINAPEGRIDIGSQSRSVAADKQARIIFTSDRPVNTGWDPEQLTKGLLSHGTVNIYGADKQDKVRLAKNALAGDDTLSFKDNLTGWRVGDKIVLAGTSYSNDKSDRTNERFRDEVLTIREINGKTIRFTNDNASNEAEKTKLRFDHKKHSQLDPNKIDLYAANLSRNVSFETENGKDVPISHRAHVMLMHNPNVKVLNAGFYDLGRSDKTKLVDDVGENVDGSKGYGKNPRGRYSVHFHLTGLDSKQPVVLEGSVVSGNPGWGIVQHESHAVLKDNVVFDVAGAGIVAESGNETGRWEDNISIKSTGVPSRAAQGQHGKREKRFDFGFEGDGYWIHGAAQIANTDNVAISANHNGMALFSGSLDVEYDFRPVETIAVEDLPAAMRSLFPGLTDVDIRHIPTATVKGFESYNSNHGLDYWGHGTNFDGELDFSEPYVAYKTPTAHEGRSLVTDFKTWGNRHSGVSIQYSSNVDLKNGIVAGVDTDTRVSGGRGVFVNHATYNSVVDGVDVQGFKEGIHFEQLPTDKDYNTNTLQNSKVTDSTYNLSKVADEYLDNNRNDDFGAFFKFKNNQFEAKGSNRAPVARFSSRGGGGLSVKFDASASFDPDPYVPGEGRPKPVTSKGIAAYGWDVDNNGSLDYFGRTLTHAFSGPGRRTVGLSVIDAQGKETTLQQTVNVQPTRYSNAFIGGSFDAGTPVQKYAWMDNSQWADKGWFISPKGTRVANGVAQLSKVGQWAQHIGQVVRNEGVHKGKQTLSFRLQNVEGSKNSPWKNNEITVSLWGINGQFDNTGWDTTGPQQVGSLPMQRTQLVSQSYGGPEGESFDWKKMDLNVDLGKGYEYLLFQVNTERGNDSGDRIAIDNVSLAGKANAVPGQGTSSPVASPTQPPTQYPTNPPTTPSTGPSSATIELDFNQGSGAIALNTAAAGNSTNAQLQNGAQRVNGRQGKVVKLDGNNDVVLLEGSPTSQLSESKERTIAMWFYADKAKTGNKQVLYEEGHNGKGLNLYLEDGLLYSGGWDRQPNKWKGDWIESKQGQIVSGRWHHVALVLEGTETIKDGALTAYLDGKEIGSAQGSQLGQRPSGIGIGNVIGSTFFEDGSVGRSGVNGFSGRVDDVAIFDDALSAQQVRSLMD